MFAVVEAGLIAFWRDGLGKRSRPGASALINSLTSSRKIFYETTANVHSVRRYRNTLVHEEDAEDAASIGLADARNYPCRFFSSLPEDW